MLDFFLPPWIFFLPQCFIVLRVKMGEACHLGPQGEMYTYHFLQPKKLNLFHHLENDILCVYNPNLLGPHTKPIRIQSLPLTSSINHKCTQTRWLVDWVIHLVKYYNMPNSTHKTTMQLRQEFIINVLYSYFCFVSAKFFYVL